MKRVGFLAYGRQPPVFARNMYRIKYMPGGVSVKKIRSQGSYEKQLKLSSDKAIISLKIFQPVSFMKRKPALENVL